MDKFAERKKFTSCKLVAAAAVAMCLLGSAGFEANAAPAPQVVSAQKATLTISGTVKDSKGEPVIGANVMEKGTNRGIVTDLDGKFTLKVTPGATITVSYLGYKTQTLKAAPTMNVSLEEDNALLDEVVVVGFRYSETCQPHRCCRNSRCVEGNGRTSSGRCYQSPSRCCSWFDYHNR